MSTLHAAWSACLPRLAKAWRNARGPINIAHLELDRIGWRWRAPFIVEDDRRAEICLANISPKAFKAAARDGMMRSLARALAAKGTSAGSEGARFAFEQIRSMVTARNIPPRDEGCIRALFCGGVLANKERATMRICRERSL